MNPKHSGVDLGSKAPSCAVRPSKPPSAPASAPIHEILFPDETGISTGSQGRHVRALDDAPTRLRDRGRNPVRGTQANNRRDCGAPPPARSQALPLSNKGHEIVACHRFVLLPPALHLDQNALS